MGAVRLQRYRETIAATAACFGVGVLDLERGGAERFHIIEHRARHELQRRAVDQHGGIGGAEALVVILAALHEIEMILEARATATLDRHAQTGAFRLGGEQVCDTRRSAGRNGERSFHTMEI